MIFHLVDLSHTLNKSNEDPSDGSPRCTWTFCSSNDLIVCKIRQHVPECAIGLGDFCGLCTERFPLLPFPCRLPSSFLPPSSPSSCSVPHSVSFVSRICVKRSKSVEGVREGVAGPQVSPPISRSQSQKNQNHVLVSLTPASLPRFSHLHNNLLTMSSNAAAAPSAKTVLSLYRSYLRVINQWPADPIRPTRNLKTALRSQVSESFRSPITGTNTDAFASRVHDAQIQLEALQRLTRNEFKQKVWDAFETCSSHREGREVKRLFD